MGFFQLDFFIYILILMLFIGVFFIIYGIITRKDAGDVTSKKMDRSISFPIKVDKLEASMHGTDEAVNALDDVSKNVFKELDGKYQELLFLYNLVDEKQKTLTLTGSNTETEQNVDQPSKQRLDPAIVRDMLFSDEADAGVGLKQKIAAVTHISTKATPKNLDVVVGDNNRRPAINPKFAHVLQLSKDGKSVEDIARDLNMGKGEIMLILNLGGRRQNA